MNATVISALAALAGAAIGGLTSVLASWLIQKTQGACAVARAGQTAAALMAQAPSYGIFTSGRSARDECRAVMVRSIGGRVRSLRRFEEDRTSRIDVSRRPSWSRRMGRRQQRSVACDARACNELTKRVTHRSHGPEPVWVRACGGTRSNFDSSRNPCAACRD
jgi:hypothetical protein